MAIWKYVPSTVTDRPTVFGVTDVAFGATVATSTPVRLPERVQLVEDARLVRVRGHRFERCRFRGLVCDRSSLRRRCELRLCSDDLALQLRDVDRFGETTPNHAAAATSTISSATAIAEARRELLMRLITMPPLRAAS